jgi:RHH-type transcriptional regulator, proline utilization regulon repressor / proline dehydrogenase / delta 1-pyrroline-5-carboxylate dehydrogenase
MADGATNAGDGATDLVEMRVRELGRALLARAGRGVSPLRRAWWDDRLMALTMGDDATKVQLFRFIDALPTLTAPESARRHLVEYLDEAGSGVPGLIRVPLALAPKGAVGDRLLSGIARFAATTMAHRFIAGSTPAEAFRTVEGLRGKELAFTADLLGEAVISEAEADSYQKTCLELLRGLAGPLNASPEIRLIDRDHDGPIPRCNLSLKLTSLTTQFDALHAEKTADRVLGRLRPILRTAREVGAFVNVDMEQYAHKDLTYDIFRAVMDEPEFRDWPNVGIVCQAYLPEAIGDLERMLTWVNHRGTPITIRLVKGAYWDYEVLHAQQLGWPIPVYTEKWQSDANYERCARFLMEHHRILRPALGSHNVRSLAFGLATAESMRVPKDAFEVQVLHGMGEPIARALAAEGYRCRVYTPYGSMLPGMAYLVRRLLENTSNESFLKASSSGEVDLDALLRNPEETGAMFGRKSTGKSETTARRELAPFQNEPLTDFTKEHNRAALRSYLGRTAADAPHPDGFEGIYPESRKEYRGGEEYYLRDPSDLSHVLERVCLAKLEHVDVFVNTAREAFDGWSRTPVAERAAVLIRAAARMRERRFHLASYEIHECGKPWREADADIAEAIDFCEFYAREMIRLDRGEVRDVPGETNRVEHMARGVVVVIPPWNFPLAIPCGMTVAALVAGNAVILKPAEQSPFIAWELKHILEEAGLPPGVLSYMPGRGETVGQALVDHPGVDIISFTGSRAVGLEINRRAAETKPGQDHVKRVIAEMGGKNATIIDDDADLDEAVVGVVQAAFSYSGQKCSACSRAIVLEGVYDAFVARLADAVLALRVGPADDPDTNVGPVIDADARTRIEMYQEIARSEGRVVAFGSIGDLGSRGHYVAPMVVADVLPSSRIAQEEVFGPILAVLKARDLGEALWIANATEYALTGGLYSRSPANIARIKREFRVGNLYINRPITGALVDRQPFGGFKLSGMGSKAGGSDYLREFLLTRTVTENTMRRGFAPDLNVSEATTLQAAGGMG